MAAELVECLVSSEIRIHVQHFRPDASDLAFDAARSTSTVSCTAGTSCFSVVSCRLCSRSRFSFDHREQVAEAVLLLEVYERDVHSEFFLYLLQHHKAHYRVAAESVECLVSSEIRIHVQHFRPDAPDSAFDAARSVSAVSTACSSCRDTLTSPCTCRRAAPFLIEHSLQRSPVDLVVRSHRYLADTDPLARHHVLRQELQAVRSQAVSADLSAVRRYVKARDVSAVLPLVVKHRAVRDFRHFHQMMPYLVKLDPEASVLDLKILSSRAQDIAFLSPHADVSRLVHDLVRIEH